MNQNKMSRLLLGDCVEKMKDIDPESIDLVITSPPYYNLKEYSHWATYEEYLFFIRLCFLEISRIIKPGRHVCWNIQDNLPEPSKDGRKYYALMPDIIKIAQGYGFEWERNIYWNKNYATQVMFGSYPYPPNMIYSCVTESICIFRKWGKTDLSNKSEESKINKAEWNIYKNSLWNIAPVKISKTLHPAAFPIQLPSRLIKMHSFINDVVLDPFMGSGTTGIACGILKRQFIGIEKDKEYFKTGQRNIIEAQNQLF